MTVRLSFTTEAADITIRREGDSSLRTGMFQPEGDSFHTMCLLIVIIIRRCIVILRENA